MYGLEEILEENRRRQEEADKMHQDGAEVAFTEAPHPLPPNPVPGEGLHCPRREESNWSESGLARNVSPSAKRAMIYPAEACPLPCPENPSSNKSGSH